MKKTFGFIMGVGPVNVREEPNARATVPMHDGYESEEVIIGDAHARSAAAPWRDALMTRNLRHLSST